MPTSIKILTNVLPLKLYYLFDRPVGNVPGHGVIG
jgi:hypothetical protein